MSEPWSQGIRLEWDCTRKGSGSMTPDIVAWENSGHIPGECVLVGAKSVMKKNMGRTS